MYAGSFSCFCKGAVLRPLNATPSVAVVVDAARFSRLFAVRRSRGVRAFAAQQSRPLFGFRFLGRNTTQPRLANLFARFNSDAMSTVRFSMSVGKVLFGCQALKIFNAVVSLVAVYMVNLFGWGKRFQPTSRHYAVHKPFTAKNQVALIVPSGGVRLELSENFSAARHGVKVVEESVLDSVYVDAGHAVPFKVATES